MLRILQKLISSNTKILQTTMMNSSGLLYLSENSSSNILDWITVTECELDCYQHLSCLTQGEINKLRHKAGILFYAMRLREGDYSFVVGRVGNNESPISSLINL